MMKNFPRWLAWFVLMCVCSSAQSAEIQPFVSGSLATIESRYSGQPFIVALWSITCPPCLHELEILGQWHKEHPDIPLVLISTDDINMSADIEQKLRGTGLIGADNWIFADSYVEKLRFQIDPAWRGELPRSYLYRPTGRRQAISGALKVKTLLDWRRTVSARPSERHR